MDTDHGCFASRLTTVTEGAITPNEVDYTVVGTQSAVAEIVITAENFNVNGADEERFVLFRAGMAADSVVARVANDSLARIVSRAFQRGEEGRWKGASIQAVITRDPYPTGKGYDLRLRLTPTAEQP